MSRLGGLVRRGSGYNLGGGRVVSPIFFIKSNFIFNFNFFILFLPRQRHSHKGCAEGLLGVMIIFAPDLNMFLACGTAAAKLQVVLAWNPEAMYAMLGEGARRSLEVPAFRKSSRKHLAPGFSREALRHYMSKVGGGVL